MAEWAVGACLYDAAAQAAVILLDTNAIVWLAQGHRRARTLHGASRLHISPASLLEIQFLVEAGRLRFKNAVSVKAVAGDLRWRLDEPPAAAWFSGACELAWTRDPFDRLIAAHAAVRRWRLATGDEHLLEAMPSSAVLPL